MKRILSLVLVLGAIISCKAGPSDKKIETADSITNAINSKSNKSFKELIEAVPVTELPFGVLGIDTIWTYPPCGSGLPKLNYDSLNIYGLNNYFQNNVETFDILSDGGVIALYDISEIPTEREKYVDFYFVARLPKHKGLESLIYYFQEIIVKDDGVSKYYDRWVWLHCEDDGKVKYAHYIAYDTPPWSNGYEAVRLYLIKKGYEETSSYFMSPRSDIQFFYNNGSSAGSMKDEYDIPHRLIAVGKGSKGYIWINNKPFEVKDSDTTPDSVRNRYEKLMGGAKAK